MEIKMGAGASASEALSGADFYTIRGSAGTTTGGRLRLGVVACDLLAPIILNGTFEPEPAFTLTSLKPWPWILSLYGTLISL